MKLKKILEGIQGIEVKGTRDVAIQSITNDSRTASPGSLFIAKKGKNFDSGQYIDDVIQAGAVAVVTDVFNPFNINIVQVIYPFPEKIESLIARNFYGPVDQKVKLFGITGTNGKTTSVHLLHHILMREGCGLSSTIARITGPHHFPSHLTTPDVLSLYKLISDMKTCSLKYGAIEVSSHALEQERVGKLNFAAALFTNISHEHLDYHVTMDSYLQSKSKLFSGLQKESPALFNADDPQWKKIAKLSTGRVITFAIYNDADIKAINIRFIGEKTQFDVKYQGEVLTFETPLLGEFNLYNCLGVIGLCLSMNMPRDLIIAGVNSFKGIKGRLERVKRIKEEVYVDFAHTPKSLEEALKALREKKPNRLLVLFGCGGNRDREKRPLMGRVAEAHADISIITEDNSRNENITDIINEITCDMTRGKHMHIIRDRGDAISKALSLMKTGDVLLVAGRGHETTLQIKEGIIPFDDVSMIEKKSLINCGDLL